MDRDTVIQLNIDHWNRIQEVNSKLTQEERDIWDGKEVCIFYNTLALMRKAKELDDIVRTNVSNKPRRFLDLGAGVGEKSILIKIMFQRYEYSGIDLIHSLPEQNITKMAIEDMGETFHNRYDLVYSNHVMEHVIDPKEALKVVYNLLDHGGVYGQCTPFLAAIGKEDTEPSHISQLTLLEWRSLIESVGFTIVESIIDFHCPDLPCSTIVAYKN